MPWSCRVCCCRGSLLQIVLALVVAIGFLVLQTQSQPYRSPIDNYLSTSCNVCVVLLLVLYTTFKVLME